MQNAEQLRFPFSGKKEEEQQQSDIIVQTKKEIPTWIIGILTSMIMFLFGFMWNTNKDFAKEQEKNQNVRESIIDMKADLKQLLNDTRLIKENSIKQDGRMDIFDFKLNELKNSKK